MTERIRQLCRIAPLFPVFICFALGALSRGKGWGMAENVLCLGFICLLCRGSRCLVLSALLCLCLGYLRLMLSEKTYGGMKRGRGIVELKLEGVPLTGIELSELDAGRGMVTASLQRASWCGRGHCGGPCRGSLAVLKADSELRQELRRLLPGDLIMAHATWEMLPDAQDPAEGFYRDVLRSRNIDFQCSIIDYRKCGRSGDVLSALRRMLYALRMRLAAMLVGGVHDRECAGMLLALGLGMAEYMPMACVERMVASGTLHVFAISGMHAGMMAALFSRFLRWGRLPLRLRWAVTVLGIGAYVLLTGVSVSALRALLMAAVIHYSYLRFRRPSWLNALGISGFLSLMLRPCQVLGMGFLYSYSVVAMLLLAAPLSDRVGAVMQERHLWLPGEFRRRAHRYVWRNVVLALLTSSVAWLTSCGVGMNRNSAVNFSAPLVNVPLTLIAFFTLAACPLKILLRWLCAGMDGLWGMVLGGMMRLMMALAEAGSDSALLLYCGRIPFPMTVLYNFLLLLWLLGYWRPGDDVSGGIKQKENTK